MPLPPSLPEKVPAFLGHTGKKVPCQGKVPTDLQNELLGRGKFPFLSEKAKEGKGHPLAVKRLFGIL
jgi:hypothetical protein